MARILGIDPGSRVTGYGLIDTRGDQSVYVDSGCVQVAGAVMCERLRMIFEALGEVVARYQPQQVAVEQVFMHRNPGSALKLGQARGAAICAVVANGLPVHEYAPRQVKQAVVGTGAAEKGQVQHMVGMLLGLRDPLGEDAADALAVALCHQHTGATLARLPGVRGVRGGRWR